LVLASTVPAVAGDATPGFVEDLARGLADRYDVTVLAPRVPASPASRDFPGGRVVRFAYLPRRWERVADGAILENLRSSPALWLQVPALVAAEAVATWRAVHRYRPAVLHAHWLVPQGVVAAVVAPTTPLVVTAHGADVYGLPGAVGRVLRRFVVRRASRLTAANADLMARLIDAGADPSRTAVLPMGVDLAAVSAAIAVVEQVPGRVVVVGRLVEKKGVHVLVAALRTLPPGGSWSLDVVGDGPWRARLEAQADGLPVRFLGSRDRGSALAAVAAASVVAVPSTTAASGDRDGLPVVLLEAMAAGRAVVASDLPGIGDVVVDGSTGLLVSPGDVAALATALARVLDDASLGERLGSAAALAAAELDTAAAATKYAAVLDAAAGARSG
jgi:glycosyltransferase involved in cell wall biosynthesis